MDLTETTTLFIIVPKDAEAATILDNISEMLEQEYGFLVSGPAENTFTLIATNPSEPDASEA